MFVKRAVEEYVLKDIKLPDREIDVHVYISDISFDFGPRGGIRLKDYTVVDVVPSEELTEEDYDTLVDSIEDWQIEELEQKILNRLRYISGGSYKIKGVDTGERKVDVLVKVRGVDYHISPSGNVTLNDYFVIDIVPVEEVSEEEYDNLVDEIERNRTDELEDKIIKRLQRASDRSYVLRDVVIPGKSVDVTVQIDDVEYRIEDGEVEIEDYSVIDVDTSVELSDAEYEVLVDAIEDRHIDELEDQIAERVQETVEQTREDEKDITLCDAIFGTLVLKIRYGGGDRIIEPHAYGRHITTGREVLRAWQQSGHSNSGIRRGWKLFLVDEIRNIKVLKGAKSGAPRPLYNPDDRHMDVIYCAL